MLAIAGGKGGTGKTTTALGLARALPGEVLVADADVDMPDLHRLAGVPREPDDDESADALDAAHASDQSADVLVLPAPLDADVVGQSWLARLDRVDRPVLVDVPAGAGRDAAAPIRASDGVVLVSTMCAPAVRDTAKTAAMSRTLGTDVVGAVLTRTGIRPPGVSRLLGCDVLGAVPDVEQPVLDKPIVKESYATVASSFDARVVRRASDKSGGETQEDLLPTHGL